MAIRCRIRDGLREKVKEVILLTLQAFDGWKNIPGRGNHQHKDLKHVWHFPITIRESLWLEFRK